MSGRDRDGGFLSPDYEPGEFDAVERRLRRALLEEAERMEPADRLEVILATARGGGPVPAVGDRRWLRRTLVPLAAAATVAALAGTLWLAGQGQDRDADVAATRTGPSAATGTGPSPATSEPAPTSPTDTPSPTGTTAPATRALLPAYFVGPVGGDRELFRLHREFLRSDSLPATAPDEEKALAALRLAMDAQPFSDAEGYLQPWSGTRAEAVDVTGEVITISLSGPGSGAVTDRDVQRVAVQQLVWTAQAAVGKGTIPVRFEVTDGSTALFGRFPTSESYNRPPSREEYYTDLAPIWVTAPARGQELPAGKPVTVKGEASVFEANVTWELRRGSAKVRDGFATASAGAPARGEYAIDLGVLPPGQYTVVVLELSMEDGTKVNAQDSVTFMVK